MSDCAPEPAVAVEPDQTIGGWRIKATWPDGRSELLGGFSSERDAYDWIENEALHLPGVIRTYSYGVAALMAKCDDLKLTELGCHFVGQVETSFLVPLTSAF